MPLRISLLLVILIVSAQSDLSLTRQHRVRQVIAHWYEDFSASDEATLHTFKQEHNLSAAQEKAATLVLGLDDCSNGGDIHRSCRIRPENEGWGERALVPASAHKCKGMLKHQCLLFDVCFAVDQHVISSGNDTQAPQRMMLQYYLSGNQEEEEDTHVRMKTYSETAVDHVEDTRRMLSRTLRGCSMLDTFAHSRTTVDHIAECSPSRWMDVEILSPHLHLCPPVPAHPSGKFLGREAIKSKEDADVAILIRADAMHVGAHTLLSGICFDLVASNHDVFA